MKYWIVLFFLGLHTFNWAQLNQTDSKGRKQGEWAKTYPNSRVYQYKGQFKDDKPIGTFTYFYPNTKVKAVIKHDANSNRSVAYMYHDNGEIMSYGIYRDMKKDSVWLNFGPSGRLSNTETYRADSLHGPKTVYFVPEDPNDKTQRVASVYNYVNGKVDGSFIEYYDNGVTKKTGKFVNNRREGEWITYEPTGKRMMLERFKNGVKHGWFIAYDAAGNEANRVYYYHGKLVEGEALKELLQQMKERGINPNG